jgi:hypothetical protein
MSPELHVNGTIFRNWKLELYLCLIINVASKDKTVFMYLYICGTLYYFILCQFSLLFNTFRNLVIQNTALNSSLMSFNLLSTGINCAGCFTTCKLTQKIYNSFLLVNLIGTVWQWWLVWLMELKLQPSKHTVHLV